MRYVKTTVFIVVVAWVAGCIHRAPVAEFQLFRQASTNVQTASQPLFDDLAAAERRQGRIVARDRVNGGLAFDTDSVSGDATDKGMQQALAGIKCRKEEPIWQPTGADGSGFIRGFCLEDALYFSDIGDPPATRAFRGGLKVLDKYSKVLVFLAEGKNVEAAKAQLQSIGTSLADAVSLVPGAQAAVGMVVPILTALEPVVKAAAEAANYKELKRLVTEASPHFSRLVLALQVATPEMFETLTESAVGQATPGNLRDDPQLAKRLVDEIEGYRKVLSDFVLLLNALGEAHKYIVEALEHGREQPYTLAGLSERSQGLTIKADTLRQAYVILRHREVH